MNKFKQTNRSFYGKWLYKATFSVPGISVLRTTYGNGLSDLLDSPPTRLTRYPHSYIHDAVRNKDTILKMAFFLDSYTADKYATRVERQRLDVYTNDQEFFKQITNEFSVRLVHAFSPAVGEEALLLNKKNILVKKYPHNRYRHKVFLSPHKIIDEDEKKDILKWISAQNGKITVSTAVVNWFIQTKWDWDRRYVLVEDESTLLMFKLRCGEAVGRIYDYVISDK
jgi:hypothetical protein